MHDDAGLDRSVWPSTLDGPCYFVSEQSIRQHGERGRTALGDLLQQRSGVIENGVGEAQLPSRQILALVLEQPHRIEAANRGQGESP